MNYDRGIAACSAKLDFIIVLLLKRHSGDLYILLNVILAGWMAGCKSVTGCF